MTSRLRPRQLALVRVLRGATGWSPLGCYGMIGDVWSGRRATSAAIRAMRPSIPRIFRGVFRKRIQVLRGGSWATRRAPFATAFATGTTHSPPDLRGFRCAPQWLTPISRRESATRRPNARRFSPTCATDCSTARRLSRNTSTMSAARSSGDHAPARALSYARNGDSVARADRSGTVARPWSASGWSAAARICSTRSSNGWLSDTCRSTSDDFFADTARALEAEHRCASNRRRRHRRYARPAAVGRGAGALRSSGARIGSLTARGDGIAPPRARQMRLVTVSARHRPAQGRCALNAAYNDSAA